jgi:hypothetical protein
VGQIEDEAGVDDAIRHAGVVDEPTVERVARAALARSERPSMPWSAIAALVAAVCIVAFGAWWTYTTKKTTTFTIETSGHLIYVRAADGASWIATWPVDSSSLPEGASIVMPAPTAREAQ